MAGDDPHPEPATHDQTVRVGEYDIAPGAKLQQANPGPVGANEYTAFVVLDVDPDAGELDLYRIPDRTRRTVTASGLEADVGVSTFVIDDGGSGD